MTMTPAESIDNAQDSSRAAAVATLIDATLGDTGPEVAQLQGAFSCLGVSEATGSRIAETVHRAHRDHARLRRREQELTALFSSARELAELRDSDALLDRLVERAHQMMGSDLTYLSEYDPLTAELRVRTTTGSVSTAFRTLRVPAGRGLASVIVETRAPQSVLRYGEYREERHEPDIDSAVAAEGIVSMLGVPMLSGDDVLGVLFVATREEYTFAPEQIALLSALADHASVVLQTAQTLRSLQRSEDDARQALERLTNHLAERDRANTVHQELVQAVLAGGGFGPLVATLSSALGRPVLVVDDGGAVLAEYGGHAVAPMAELSEHAQAAIDESRRSGHCVLIDDASDVCGVVALAAGARRFGAVLLGRGAFELTSVDRRTVERAAQVGALLSLQQEAVAEAEHRVQSELVADLLDAVPERRGDVERRARRLGIAIGDLDTLIAFSLAGDQRTSAARALAPLVGPHCLVGEYHGVVVALAPAGSPLDAAALRQQLADAVAVPVLAIEIAQASDLTSAFDDARRTSRLLAALDVDDITASADDYLPYSAILDTDARALRSFIDKTIGAVRRYDAERGTELIRTLRAFVRSNGSPTGTARLLNFHTNTILQRLDRLDHILGADWRDNERLFRLSIAVRLDQLREQLLGTAPQGAGRQ